VTGRSIDDRAARLPARYGEDWRAPFDAAARACLVPGMRILDVGSGRSPTLRPSDRPAGCRYVGLDLSRSELIAAGAAAYDEVLVGDIADPNLAISTGQFDLALSWQVLEHVTSLEAALTNVRQSLAPGAHFVAQFSGRKSAIALANRAVPGRLSKFAMRRLLGRDPRSVFAAPYDRCTYDDLVLLFAAWSSVTITPRFRAATYLGFLRPAQWAYLKYEDWTMRSGRNNLATHYLIDAVR
jgi:SAM-dependent methyltransferase